MISLFWICRVNKAELQSTGCIAYWKVGMMPYGGPWPCSFVQFNIFSCFAGSTPPRRQFAYPHDLVQTDPKELLEQYDEFNLPIDFELFAHAVRLALIHLLINLSNLFVTAISASEFLNFRTEVGWKIPLCQWVRVIWRKNYRGETRVMKTIWKILEM